MTPVCPFVKATRPDDPSVKKNSESQSKPVCPFAKSAHCDDQNLNKPPESESKQEPDEQASIPAKCPYGFDSQTFKLGPFSCMICQALLFECSKCVPCSHVFCKACVSRFKDCPLCGADIEKIEDDPDLQKMVDSFIEGHARIKRSQSDSNQDEAAVGESKTVIYADVSLERGSFLVQQAMRAFRASNIESAKSRLILCAEDVREQITRVGNTSELCSQLGAVLGMLGDCCRAAGDVSSAVTYFEESVGFLLKVAKDDSEVTHTLSVSLNKIGDLKYHAEDLEAARSFYLQALDVRKDAMKHQAAPSQILDVAVSLAKVADVDRNLGNENAALDRFQEAIKLMESLKLTSEESNLEQKRLSVLEFLNGQLSNKQPNPSS